MVHNPIYPGFIWRQAFDFPAGFFQLGDVVRAEFRRAPASSELLTSIDGGSSALIDGDRLFVELTEEQTASISQRIPRVVTNFVIDRADEEIPIGQIISIPVVTLPTRPE